ncbi:MAG: hypothetical protein Q9191_003281 [Dirinaria sp. TL-2023a]
MVSSFAVFTLFTLACAVAPNWPSFLVFRLFCGITASSAIAVVGGLFADVYGDPVTRGRAMAVFMAVSIRDPLLQLALIPVGYDLWAAVGPRDLRLCVCCELEMDILVSLLALFFLPETYGPTLLKRRAQKLRTEGVNTNVYAPIELEKKGAKQMITVTLMRPLNMFLFEAIRAKKKGAHWTSVEEYRRLPLACLGGPLYIISLFWLGWSASPDVHWIVPMLAGIPFGVGFLLIFMALLNYIADAYEIFANSAARPMYAKLGIPWASSLLGFLSLGMTIIPFAFIKYGDRIRANSKFCQELKAKKAQIETERRQKAGMDHGSNGSTPVGDDNFSKEEI